jgi:hypothetical protein
MTSPDSGRITFFPPVWNGRGTNRIRAGLGWLAYPRGCTTPARSRRPVDLPHFSHVEYPSSAPRSKAQVLLADPPNTGCRVLRSGQYPGDIRARSVLFLIVPGAVCLQIIARNRRAYRRKASPFPGRRGGFDGLLRVRQTKCAKDSSEVFIGPIVTFRGQVLREGTRQYSSA